MVKNWEKYINKSPFKKELNEIIKDISDNNLDEYYIKKLIWYDSLFRIRVGKIRIVFEKKTDGNYIVAVDTRWQIYRGL